MTGFTTCDPQTKDYDIAGGADKIYKGFSRAVARFLPATKLTPENIAQVRWHLASEDCEEQFLKPLSVLLTGEFVPGPGDTIHLHEAIMQSNGQREDSTTAAPQHSLVDEEYDDNGGSNDDERSEGGDHTGVARDDEHDQDQDEDQDEASTTSDDATSDDSQTDEMDENLADDYLYIKLIYDLKGATELPKRWLDAKALPTEVLSFPRILSLPEVYEELTEVVERRLRKQASKAYHRLVDGGSGWSLLLRPTLEHDCPVKQLAFNFDDRGISRVNEVNDLLHDAQDSETGAFERDTQPQLTIKLTLVDLIKRPVATHPFIIIRSGALTKDTGGRACVYRIGAQTRPRGRQEHAVKVSDACFWYCPLGNDQAGVRLVEAYHWSLRDLEICSPCEGRICGDNLVRLEQADIKGPATTTELRQRLKNGELQPYIEGSLLYNFKTWLLDMALDLDMVPVTEFPGKDITVAVRYINHLSGNKAEALRFPLGEEVLCGQDDNYTSLCAAFMRNLQREKANAALFQPPLKGRWKLEVWVMPQIPNGRSLFGFEGEAKLMHWLHRSYVAKGDTVLFAEVHLCPKVTGKTTTRGGRMIQKK